MSDTATGFARKIFDAATPVIKIHKVGGKRWKRNVAKGARIGPWLPADYSIINDGAWKRDAACLYLVESSDTVIRYV